MDYENFKKELEEYDDWERINVTRPRVVGEKLTELEGKHAFNDAWLKIDDWTGQEDRVNSPSHYTRGKQEVIDTIEEAIQDAPSPVEGMLQGQVLKYVLRVWLKDNSLEDLKKAQWYLTRLIKKMEGGQ